MTFINISFFLLHPNLKSCNNPKWIISLTLYFQFLFPTTFLSSTLKYWRVCIYPYLEMIFDFISLISFFYFLLLSDFLSILYVQLLEPVFVANLSSSPDLTLSVYSWYHTSWWLVKVVLGTLSWKSLHQSLFIHFPPCEAPLALFSNGCYFTGWFLDIFPCSIFFFCRERMNSLNLNYIIR